MLLESIRYDQQLQSSTHHTSGSPQSISSRGALSTDSIVIKIVQLITQNGGRIRGSNLGSLLSSENGGMCVHMFF